MEEHPNLALLRRGYAAFRTGDAETLRSVFSEDIIWHTPGRHPLAGDYHGQAEVFGLFGRLAELSGGTFRLDIREILANDTHVVALAHMIGSRAGVTLEDDVVHVYRVADGRIVEFWGYVGDPYGADDFWSR